MKRTLLGFAMFWLLAGPALAQQPPTTAQRLQQVIGNLIGENAELAVKIDSLNLQIIDLRKQLEEKSNALKQPKASQNDGGGRAQPEVRKEDGNPAGSRQRLQHR